MFEYFAYIQKNFEAGPVQLTALLIGLSSKIWDIAYIAILILLLSQVFFYAFFWVYKKTSAQIFIRNINKSELLVIIKFKNLIIFLE